MTLILIVVSKALRICGWVSPRTLASVKRPEGVRKAWTMISPVGMSRKIDA